MTRNSHHINLIISIWFLFLSLFAYSQSGNNQLESLNRPGTFTMKDSLGNFIGCDLNLECRGMGVVFYEIEVDKPARHIVIKGKVYDARWTTNSDTIGIAATAFYLGKPKNKNGNVLIDLRHLKSSDSTGYFEIALSVLPEDRLYIADPMYLLQEYRIEQLLVDQ